MAWSHVYQSLVWTAAFPAITAWLAWVARARRRGLTLLLLGLILTTVNQWRTWISTGADMRFFYFSPVAPLGVSMALAFALWLAGESLRNDDRARSTKAET